MKLLVIGHPFLLAYNQRKYVAMKRLGIQVRLIAPSRGRDRFDVTNCQLHPALSQNEVVPMRAWLADSHMTYLHNPCGIMRVLREFNPDVIHIEEEPQAFITLMTLVLRGFVAPSARMTLFTWDNLLRRRGFPLDLFKRRLRAYALRRAAGVICGNHRAAELLCEEGVFSGLVEVLPQYGSDEAFHQPGTEAALRADLNLQDHVVVSYVGRFVPEKGLILLLRALSHLSSLPWKLLLVGAGPLEKEIRKKWLSQFPDRVVIVPAIPYDLVPKYLRCSDVFVLASHSTHSWMEQFGLTMSQAMLLGIPCIGSSSGAIPEVLGPGGIVFEEGNVQQLLAALEELLRCQSRRQQLGSRGREFALKNYTEQVVANRYVRFFERVISKRLAQVRNRPNPDGVGSRLKDNCVRSKQVVAGP